MRHATSGPFISMLSLLALLLAGCSSAPLARLEPSDFPSLTAASSPNGKAGEGNYQALTRYQAEWSHYKKPDIRPRQCLALSGGGVRSAAFSIGIMHGLHDIGRLRELDVISAVSGGSYALYWYYAHHLRGEVRTDDDLFSDEYRQFLIDHAAFVGNVDPFSSLVGATEFIVNIPPAVLGQRWINTSLAHSAYRIAIERTFNGAYDRENLKTKFPTWRQLGELVEKARLPIFVVNLSLSNPISDGSARFTDKIYEVTPFWASMNATINGRDDELDKELAAWTRSIFKYFVDVIATSGAAVSSEAAGGGFHALGYELGRYFPLEHSDPKKHVLIHLGDGGFTDNLATFSLVRRLCSDITIVDAGYDPGYTFDDYSKLKSSLNEELGANLAVKEIDELIDKQRQQKLKGCGRFGQKPCITFSGTTPVMKGTIGRFPVRKRNSDEIEQISIDVTYIKLSVDKVLVNSDPERFEKSYGSKVLQLFRESGGADFPQYPTYQQRYTAERFEAYLDLGYCIVRHYWSHRGSNVEMDGCQPAASRKKAARGR
jgi:hypothetical protein